jgi:MFS family permease
MVAYRLGSERNGAFGGRGTTISTEGDAPARRPRRGRRLRPFYGWWIVIVAALVAFASGPGQSYGFSVFIDHLIEDTGFSRTEISALYAVGTGLSAFMVFMVGRLADKYGARVMLVVAASGLGFACFGMAFAVGPIAFFFAFAALRALGQGSMPVNGTLLVAQWFVRYRGRAMAIMGIGGALSNAAFPTISQQLIEMFGWRETYMILGVFVWVLILPLAIFVVRNRPEDIDAHPDGADEMPESERRAAGSTEAPESANALRTAFFWVTALSIGVPSMVGTAYVFHQISILTEFGLSASLAAGLFVPFAITATGASFLGGYLVDRFNPIRVYTANSGLFIVATIVLVLVSEPILGFVYAGLMGLFQGIQMIIMNTTWAYFYGRRGLGNVQGAGSMTNIAYSAIGPLPLAALHGYFGDFRPAILILGALMIISAVTVNLVRKEAHGVVPDNED